MPVKVVAKNVGLPLLADNPRIRDVTNVQILERVILVGRADGIKLNGDM